MIGSGRTAGVIILILGALVACGGILVSVVSVSLDPGRTAGGMVLGVVLSMLVAAPVMGVGGFLFWRGKKELAELARIKKQKTILNMVKTQGQVAIGEIALELNATTGDVQSLIYDLVGKGLFHGYINWDDAVLYSRQASALQGATACPNCGGQQVFAGKGIVQCRHCGAQVFL
ncbi:MAG: hypothetical protein ACE5G8_03165 [Anaerolineae bacterium]